MTTSKTPHPIVKIMLLYPASLCYKLGVFVRNKLFDFDILKSRRFSIPVISIGNISVGGTGKTPHSEYVINLLQKQSRVALLSRGYRRATRGFVLGSADATAQAIGDEPYQILKKFPNITVAVDEKRAHGIDELMQLKPAPEVVVLDDAYQHRYVTAGLSILLLDYNRLQQPDYMLPLGRLREPVKNTDRADIIIVSKCPVEMKPVEMMTLRKEVNPYPYQAMYFSYYDYRAPQAVFADVADKEWIDLSTVEVLAVTAIAQVAPFHRYLKNEAQRMESLTYQDHHFFTAQNYKQIEAKFESLNPENRIIVVTEKDRARLLNDAALPEKLKPYLYSVGIEVKFLNHRGKAFDRQILEFVHRFQRK